MHRYTSCMVEAEEFGVGLATPSTYRLKSRAHTSTVPVPTRDSPPAIGCRDSLHFLKLAGFGLQGTDNIEIFR